MIELNPTRRGRCLKPLAIAAGNMRKAGKDFKSTVTTVEELAERLKFQGDPLHLFLYSTIGITTLVGYEYLSANLKAHGINAPSAFELVGMLPVASISKNRETTTIPYFDDVGDNDNPDGKEQAASIKAEIIKRANALPPRPFDGFPSWEAYKEYKKEHPNYPG